jgi:1-deoxy-D-xylulose-5-phosphate synthase
VRYSELFPERYFDVGIAESHAVTMSAAMAKQGMLPVCAIYSTFLQRAYDQVVHDAAIQNLPVIFALDRAGIIGEDGETHQGIFDLAYLSHIPNVDILCPSSFTELDSMLSKALSEERGPTVIRYPRGGEGVYKADNSNGNVVLLKDGGDLIIFTHGIMANSALEASNRLAHFGVSAGVVKINSFPITDIPSITEIAQNRGVVVLEDVVYEGGAGQKLTALMAQYGVTPRYIRLLNLGSCFPPHGGVRKLHEALRIDPAGICRAVLAAEGRKNAGQA